MKVGPTWRLREVTYYTADCPHCGFDLFSDCDYSAWGQPEGVEASLEDQDWCPKCEKPLTVRGYELEAERDL